MMLPKGILKTEVWVKEMLKLKALWTVKHLA